MGKDILILGGGTGGIVAALAFAEAKKKHGLDINVTLVNKDEWHYMPPLWMDVALEGLPLDKTRAPIKGLEKYGVNVVIKEAVKIDPDNRSVEAADGTKLAYDYLFVTLGLRNGWEAIPGYDKAGYHNYEPEAAVEFNKALQQFKGGKIVIVAPELPFRCGIYPVEFATVLGHMLHLKGIKSEIVVLSPRMPDGRDISWGLGPDIARLWHKYFEKYGISVKIHDGIEKVDDERKVVVTKNYEESYDLLVKVPPPRPPKVLEDPKFLFEQDKRFVKARPLDFRHPEYDDIFLTGEHSMPPTGLGTAGVFVHAATYKAAMILLHEEYGVGEPHDIHPVACVAYSGDKGFMGVCEVDFDGTMYNWRNCYNVMESFAMKLVKRGFYQGWLDKLRV
ncbi:MAG: FAD-dependent oxidoreductase [Desulfurococcales archaeon]|nr:FAD-dependent oxidoreductase [Desulfurococcales archaeon]